MKRLIADCEEMWSDWEQEFYEIHDEDYDKWLEYDNNVIKSDLKPVTLQEFSHMNYTDYYFTFDETIWDKRELESTDYIYKTSDDDYYLNGHGGLNKNDLIYIVKKELVK